jgi:NUMOD4 motif
MTEWRTIPGFPDYELSGSGEVRRTTSYGKNLRHN